MCNRIKKIIECINPFSTQTFISKIEKEIVLIKGEIQEIKKNLNAIQYILDKDK